MLVLTRGENDRVVFPSLGISIEVLRVSTSRTSLGIKAPKSIRVVRHELLEDGQEDELLAAGGASGGDAARALRHEFRNQINRATLKLQLAAKFFARGETEQGLANMTAGMAELSKINGEAATDSSPSAKSMNLAEAKETFQASQTTSTGGQRVLLVDDDDNERALMASYLNRCGLDVLEARDGLMALYMLAGSELPDVVLMDMNMPNLGGRETIEQIRKCSTIPNVPVFAVTAEPMAEAGMTISAEGVTGWFQKPVQVEQIVEAIERCTPANA